MTQKTLAQQISEMQNNLAALDKLMQAEIENNTPTETKVKSFLITYVDGTTKKFIEEVEFPKLHLNRIPLTVEEVKSMLKPQPARAKYVDKTGKPCIIDGVEYVSVAAASRALNVHKGGVTARIHSDFFPTWNYA